MTENEKLFAAMFEGKKILRTSIGTNDPNFYEFIFDLDDGSTVIITSKAIMRAYTAEKM